MSDAVTQQETGLSQVERVVDTFVAPSKTFTDILRNASWWLPFLIMLVVTVGVAFTVDKQVGYQRVAENQVQQNPKQADQMAQLTEEQRAQRLHGMGIGYKYTSYCSFVLILIFVAIFALLYWASFNFGLGARTTFGQMFAVWMYAGLPKVVAGILTIITLFVGGNAESYNMQNPVGTNPAYFMPDAAPWLRAFLSFFDVLSFWELALLILGTAIVAKVSKGKAATVVLGWWAIGLLLSVGLAAAFS